MIQRRSHLSLDQYWQELGDWWGAKVTPDPMDGALDPRSGHPPAELFRQSLDQLVQLLVHVDAATRLHCASSR
jgi:hypothetical protein